eukprot:c29855_g1_i1 orf=109-279(+)
MSPSLGGMPYMIPSTIYELNGVISDRKFVMICNQAHKKCSTSLPVLNGLLHSIQRH